ncbi:MAG TPA: integrin alpha [Acidimicrobiales bacterium]|nr:integrin alpha [Acidimicrobiales bacterium]
MAAVTAGALAVTGAPTSRSSTPATPYEMTRVASPNPQATGRWAERLVAAGDLNDDGVNDFFVGALSENVGGNTNQGRAYAVNGRTFAVLYTIESPEPQALAQFAFYVSSPGDVSGDGKSDVVIGTDAQDVAGNVDQGAAWAFSGSNGSVLYRLDNPVPQASARFGSRIGRAGDINGDSVPDVIVGASGNDVPAGCGIGAPAGTAPAGCRINQGQAFVFNGVNGALLRTLDLPVSDHAPAGTCATNCGSLGLAVQGPGDTNGDGVTDQLVDASNYSTGAGCTYPVTPEPNDCNEGQGRMYVYSGKTGEVLLRIDDPDPQAGATFGFQDVAPLSPGDVNGDGFADLYANGFAQNGPTGESEGRGWVFNGRTGALLHTLNDPTPNVGGQFGWSMARTDYNRDGNPDLYVGSSPHHVPNSPGGRGGTYVFNGVNGALLKTLELPAADAQDGAVNNNGSNLGWGLAAPGDLNGDGQPDYLGGAPFQDVSADVDEGALFPFLSKGAAGYHLVARDGGIFSFGDAKFAGSTGAIKLNQPVVGMASTPNFEGYWLVASDGGIFAFGDARFFGSTGAIKLNKPIVGMASTPSGKGYWLVATDGGVFAFGDARFFGSTGAIKLNKPVVGMASTPTGNGYWLVASDGGIFAFGDARFSGSTGAIKLNKPIVGMAGSPTGKGYWLVATDGGVFAFGDARFAGSTGAITLNQPMVGMAPTPSGRGYNLVATDGGIFSFGDAKFAGSTGAIKLNLPVVGMAGVPPLTDS